MINVESVISTVSPTIGDYIFLPILSASSLGVNEMWWPFKPKYPRPMQSFFRTHCCPDCGSKALACWEDGGHDFAMECQKCKSKFGVQAAPFEIIERIGEH